MRLVREPALVSAGAADSAFSKLAEWGWQAIERLSAVALLILLLPLLSGVALAVWLLSRQSPLVAHRRVGLGGEEFWMLKLRTMWEKETPPRRYRWVEYLGETHVPSSKGSPDPRVTSRLARFCRRFSLDELPQLLHVSSGRMRLVGPRPITRAEWDCHYGAAAIEVLSVAPGITGMWQVLGRNRLTYPQRRRLDLFYARRRSSGLDLLLLLRTAVCVFSGRDSG